MCSKCVVFTQVEYHFITRHAKSCNWYIGVFKFNGTVLVCSLVGVAVAAVVKDIIIASLTPEVIQGLKLHTADLINLLDPGLGMYVVC